MNRIALRYARACVALGISVTGLLVLPSSSWATTQQQQVAPQAHAQGTFWGRR